MTEPVREKLSGKVTTPQDGKGAGVKKPSERYCAVCGADADVHGLATERFGEVFCSDGHAEEFVQEVRAARVQAAAAALSVPPSTTEVERPEGQAPGAPRQQDWKRYLKLGACCGAPLLALIVLAGGGGALLGAAGAILPLLLVLACPIGMYFAMRGMMKTEHRQNAEDKGNPEDKGQDKRGGSADR